jgi:hypothetical protein
MIYERKMAKIAIYPGPLIRLPMVIDLVKELENI